MTNISLSYIVAVNSAGKVLAAVCKNNHGLDAVYAARQPEYKVVKADRLSMHELEFGVTALLEILLDGFKRKYPNPADKTADKTKVQDSMRDISACPFTWEVRTKSFML